MKNTMLFKKITSIKEILKQITIEEGQWLGPTTGATMKYKQ